MTFNEEALHVYNTSTPNFDVLLSANKKQQFCEVCAHYCKACTIHMPFALFSTEIVSILQKFFKTFIAPKGQPCIDILLKESIKLNIATKKV